MNFCESEGGYEGGFQTVDNTVRVSESGGLDSLKSYNFQPTPSTVSGEFNSFSVTTDSINFAPGGDAALNLGAEKLMPSIDLGSSLNALISMPGGLGIVGNILQALFSFFSGMVNALATTASEIAKSYATAAQASMDAARSMRG